MRRRQTITIIVTKDDIENGEGNDPLSCPVALALHRHDGLDDACAYHDTCEIWNGKGYVEIPMPKKASRFITRVDDGKAVKPFTFTLSFRDES